MSRFLVRNDLHLTTGTTAVRSVFERHHFEPVPQAVVHILGQSAKTSVETRHCNPISHSELAEGVIAYYCHLQLQNVALLSKNIAVS